MSSPDRRSEWFVPTVGPLRFRIAVGLLFLPYTGMVLAFTAIGGMLAPVVVWSRVGAIVLVYFFGLGIAAHALDALGSRAVKPWGEHFSRRQLKVAALLSLLVSYGIGGYYIFFVTPWLGVIAVLEGFFLFAYNLEAFDGRFHTDAWFAFSWGVLPTLAGFVIQTDRLSIPAVAVAGAMGALALVEINASRPYKEMKRRGAPSADGARYETILKSVSLGVILLACGLALFRRSF